MTTNHLKMYVRQFKHITEAVVVMCQWLLIVIALQFKEIVLIEQTLQDATEKGGEKIRVAPLTRWIDMRFVLAMDSWHRLSYQKRSAH